MNITPTVIPVPLRDDGMGSLRVGKTRVPLESVLALHGQGQTAERIVEAFDTLELADVHAVLAWALRHPNDVAAYLKESDEQAEEVRRQLEAAGITPTREQSVRFREQLLARKAAREQGHAAPAE